MLLFSGFLSEWKDCRDFGIVHYIVGVHCWRVSVKQGFTVFKWLQGDTETFAYCAKKVKQAPHSATDVPLAPPAKLKFIPIHTSTSACPKTSSTPLSQNECWKAAKRKERAQTRHKLQKQCVKKLRVTPSQTWQLSQSVCTVPTIFLMSASMMGYVYNVPYQ